MTASLTSFPLSLSPHHLFRPPLFLHLWLSLSSDFFFVVVVATSVSIPFGEGQYTAVIANVCNPGLIDPAEKVNVLMLDLYLRAERAIGFTEQHFGL